MAGSRLEGSTTWPTQSLDSVGQVVARSNQQLPYDTSASTGKTQDTKPPGDEILSWFSLDSRDSAKRRAMRPMEISRRQIDCRFQLDNLDGLFKADLFSILYDLAYHVGGWGLYDLPDSFITG